jgi:hypothetical protein
MQITRNRAQRCAASGRARLWAASAWLVLVNACAAGSSPERETASGGASPGAAPASVAEPVPDTGLVDEGEVPFVPVDAADACLVERAESVQYKDPVDIIIVVDNSASMEGEVAATERNINENFATILRESGLDYRVILISLHRRALRSGYGPSATMVCVEAPLSGLADCTSAPEPKFSARFFQYSTRVESDDSLDIVLDTYAPPFDAGHEDEYDNARLGWSEWLRPDVKKVFLELTDDDENMTADDFLQALAELAPEHFGADPSSPNFIFHSIVGMLEKKPSTDAYLPSEPLVVETCSKGAANATSSGLVYQELSRRTAGLRFPLCQSSSYDVVFREIAGDVVSQTGIACDFPVPAPPAGRSLDLDRVSVSLQPGGGSSAHTLGQAALLSDCESDAFYIQDGRIQLCPDACAAVRADSKSRVDVLFGCESTIIVR